jgi:hypothetical protein
MKNILLKYPTPAFLKNLAKKDTEWYSKKQKYNLNKAVKLGRLHSGNLLDRNTIDLDVETVKDLNKFVQDYATKFFQVPTFHPKLGESLEGLVLPEEQQETFSFEGTDATVNFFIKKYIQQYGDGAKNAKKKWFLRKVNEKTNKDSKLTELTAYRIGNVSTHLVTFNFEKTGDKTQVKISLRGYDKTRMNDYLNPIKEDLGFW